MRAALFLAAVLLAGAITIDPGETTQLETESDITALAMRDGWTVAGTADAGGLVPWGDGTQRDVWYVWDEGSVLRRVDDADAPGCPSPGTLSGEACKAHIVAIDMAENGRVVVAANDDDGDSSRLLFAHVAAGPQRTVELPGTVRALSINDNGTHVAVAWADDQVLTPGHVTSFSWNGQERWNTTFSSAGRGHASVLHTSNNGTVTGIHSGSFHISPMGELVERPIDGAAQAMAQAGPWQLVAGGDGKTYAFHHNDTTPTWNLKPTSSRMLSVAATPDGSKLATLDATGNVRIYNDVANPALATPTLQLSGAQSLHLTADGSEMAVVARDGLRYYGTHGPTLWWHDERTVDHLSMAPDGSRLAVAEGNQLRLYSVLKGFQVAMDAAPASGDPGDAGKRAFTVTNTGNRPDTLDVSVQAGSLQASAAPASFFLAPGESATGNLSWSIPAGTPAGTHEVRMQAGSTVVLPVTVREVVGWDLSSRSTEKGIDQGGSVDFDVRLANTGNVAGIASMSATIDREGWNVSIAPAAFDLRPGQTGRATVTVTAPEAAAHDDSAHVTVRGADQALQLTATVGATYGLGLTSTPPPAVEANGNTTLSVTLTNAGNVRDRVSLEVTVPDGWSYELSQADEEIAIAGGTQLPIEVHLHVGERPGTNLVLVRATSILDEERHAQTSAEVTVTEGPTSPDQDTPAPVTVTFLAIGFAALIATALRRR